VLREGRLAIVLAGLAFAAIAEAVRLRVGWPLWWVTVDAIPGVAFLVGGLVTWNRRPDARIGPLMVATGISWYAGTLAASTVPWVDRLGHAFQGYYDAFLAWLVLAYPTGRLGSRAGRLVVAALFGLLAARTVFRLIVVRATSEYDFGIPSEVERYIAEATLRDGGEAAFRTAVAVLAVAVIALLARRLIVEGDLGRRTAGPLIVAGVAFAVGIIVEIGAIALARTSSDRFAAWDIGLFATSAGGSLVAAALAVGVVRSRLARGSVADLVVELGATQDRPAIRDVIARALQDPSVDVLYPTALPERFVDAGGVARQLPPGSDPSRIATRLEAEGRTIAVVIHDAALADQPELVRSVVAAARLAIDNERLAAEVRAQLAEVRESRARIVAAGDEQRRRIERDLHDGAQQRLVTVALRLQMARASVEAGDRGASAALDEASKELEMALIELRRLARGLHPSALEGEGLRAAIEMLADRSTVRVDVDVPDRRFPTEIESTAYFVAAEALTNVARHAEASSASVTARQLGDRLVIEVRDDGVGGAVAARGSGLRGLEDRVAAVGGRLTVDSRPGAGTTIRAEIPCAS
jgi:signal transduction histidine kinase